MTAPSTSRKRAPWNLNTLRLGATYRASTGDITASGEYLGMETPHGDRSILLRRRTRTVSISLSEITSIIAIEAT